MEEYLHLSKKYELPIHPVKAVFLLENHKAIEDIAALFLLSSPEQRKFLMGHFPDYNLRAIENPGHQPSKKLLGLWYHYFSSSLPEAEMNQKIAQLWQSLSNKQRVILIEIFRGDNRNSLPVQLYQDAPYSSKILNLEIASCEFLEQHKKEIADLKPLIQGVAGKEIDGDSGFYFLCKKYNCEPVELLKLIFRRTPPSLFFSVSEIDTLLDNSMAKKGSITVEDILYSALKNNDHNALKIIINQLRKSKDQHDLFKKMTQSKKIRISPELFFKTSIQLLEENKNKDLQIFKLLDDLNTGFWPDRISNLVMKRLKDQERYTVDAELADDLIKKLALRANPLLLKGLNQYLAEFSFSEINTKLKNLADAWEFRKNMRMSFDQIAQRES